MRALKLLLAFLLVFGFPILFADVTFQWDANTETDLAGYNFYRGTVTGGPYARLNTTIITTTTYTDTEAELGVGTQYFYVVSALNTNNLESGFSNEASNYDLGSPPAAPGGLHPVPPQIALSTQIETNPPFDTGLRVSAAQPVNVKLSYYKAGSLIGDEVVALGANRTTAFNLAGERGISCDLVKAEAPSPFAITSMLWFTKGPDIKDIEFFAFPFERIQ